MLHVCLSQIVGYRQLQAEVESVRRIQYSSDNLEHEALLMQVSKNITYFATNFFHIIAII